MNEGWHSAHPMPKDPTFDQRVAWHMEHARECGCRPMPDTLKREIERRGPRD